MILQLLNVVTCNYIISKELNSLFKFNVLTSFSGENNTYQQIGNGCIEFDITLRKNGKNFIKLDGDGNIGKPIRLVNNAFAYVFSIAISATTGGE